MIASFRNAWSPRFGDGTANGGFGLTVGGEDPVLGQPIGYIGSFTYSNGQEVRSDETPGTDPGHDRRLPADQPESRRHGAEQRALGRHPQPHHPAGHQQQARVQQHLQSQRRQRGHRARRRERGVRRRPRRHPSDLHRAHGPLAPAHGRAHAGRPPRGGLVAIDVPGGPRRARPLRPRLHHPASIRSPAARPRSPGSAGPAPPPAPSASCRSGAPRSMGNYRLFLGSAGNPITVKIGGGYRAVDRDADSRSFDITNRGLSVADRQLSPEQIFAGPFAEDGRLSLFISSFGGRYDARDRLGAGYGQVEMPLASRLRLIGGARVEHWDLELNSFDPQGVPSAVSRDQHRRAPALSLNYQLTESQVAPPVGEPDAVAAGIPGDREHQLVRADRRRHHLRQSGPAACADPELRPPLGVVSPRGRDVQCGALRQAVLGSDRAGVRQTHRCAGQQLRERGQGRQLRPRAGGAEEPRLRSRRRSSALTLFANTTLMQSRITPGNDVLTSADRPMVGQAEYVVNGGLDLRGTRRRQRDGALQRGRRPDAGGGCAAVPRHVRTGPARGGPLACWSRCWPNTSLRLDAKNLLDSPYRVEQGGVTRLRYKAGRVFSFGASWSP